MLLLITFQSYSFEFTILHTNDLHSYLTGQKDIGHYGRIVTKIKELREKNKINILVDAGDFYGGTVYHWPGPRPTFSFPEWDFFKFNKYDAVTLGNHEFDAKDIGFINMLDKMDDSIPLVVSNSKNSHKKFKPHIIKKLNEGDNSLSVGIIGAIGPDACLVSRGNRSKFQFHGLKDGKADWESFFKSLNVQIKSIKDKVDLIILLLHGGGAEDEEIANRLGDIDIIIAGHTHEVYYKKVGETFISQAGSYGKYLGELVFNYNIETKKLDLIKKEHHIIDATVTKDREYMKKLPMYQEEVSQIAKEVGINISQKYKKQKENPDDFKQFAVTQVYKDLIEKEPDIDLYFTVRGLVRNQIDLTSEFGFEDVFRVFPLGFHENFRPGERIVTFYVKRSDLGMIKDFLTLYSKKNRKFKPLFSSNVKFKERWWGLPLLNNYSEVLLNNSNESEYVKIATNEFVAKYIGLVKEKTFGLFQVDFLNKEGEVVSSPEIKKYPVYYYFSESLKSL
tara:strand:- start:23955 stop:25472 length:1518 start_codon:yes stop_codon:yes gene_type:complete